MMKTSSDLTKYEIARIVGARALQIAMDAPMLLKFTKDELNLMRYDPLKIAQKEFDENVLPISVHRPLPPMRKVRLERAREEKIDDAAIIAKEKEIEEEMTEKAVEQGFVDEDDTEVAGEEAGTEEEA